MVSESVAKIEKAEKKLDFLNVIPKYVVLAHSQ